MTDSKVSRLLPKPPFDIGGPLSTGTGRYRYVPLEMHERFLDHIKKNRVRPIAMYPLSGDVGIGRTWTLCWVGRQAIEQNMQMEDERWEAALVPGLGSGEIRDLFESIFASTEYLKDEAKKDLKKDVSDPISGQGLEGIFNHALLNQSSWSVLVGEKGRFNVSAVDENPKWTQRDTQVEFIQIWLERLYELGVDNLLILVDEFEISVTRLSEAKMTDFSDGLRRLFDVVEGNQDSLPNIQLILSATTEAASQIDSTASSEQLPGWLTALQSRMTNGFSLSRVSEEEIKRIAHKCIDYRRTEEVDDRFTPYTEAAVETAFENSDGLTRRFGEIMNQMYVNCYSQDEIDEESALDSVSELGYDFEAI